MGVCVDSRVGAVAGTINRDDIAAVRERAPIEQIVGEHLALKPAGVGTLKGLCPFHDERTPSFNVRPSVGRYHCFGCGEGGDVIEFVMKLDGLSFVEAVEYLAPRAGVTLRYEAGTQRSESTAPARARLLQAQRIAAEFYRDQLASPEANVGRAFLTERGFDRDAAQRFGVGYAPQGWSALLEHLRARNFTEAELRASGLFSEGNRGMYDRFRGRLVWPIHDVTGEVIGFGARRLYEDDQGPKYLNTPETPLYKKASVLYGIDQAKSAIRSERTTVVVEGYTDVMACHLAGITNAVATCGTAFGEEHVKVVRRLMGDTGSAQLKVGSGGASVVFTFDGDEAGQNAALKSFSLDQQFLAQTFVAVDAEGMDPCEIRQHRGDDAVRALIEGRTPLFEFVIRTQLAAHDLATPEGRVSALRAAAPVVARIRDSALRPEYGRQLAGWLGMEVEAVLAEVTRARGTGRSAGVSRPSGTPAAGRGTASASQPAVQTASAHRSARPDPVMRVEALSLGVLLQAADAVRADAAALAIADELTPEAYTSPTYQTVFSAIQAAGSVRAAGPDWVAHVIAQAPDDLAATINALAVTALPHDKAETLGVYVRSVLARVLDVHLMRHVGQLRGHMQRAGEGTDEYWRLLGIITEIETRRRTLRAD